MFKMGRKTSVGEPAPAPLKDTKEASGIAQRTRRALGDITNASSSGPAGSDATKRPTLTHITGEVVTQSAIPTTSAPSQDDSEQPMEEDDRAYMRRDADDIDSRDANNPLLCTEYVNEMYQIFLDLEREFAVNPNYMVASQVYVNEKMRCILVDWLVSNYIIIHVLSMNAEMIRTYHIIRWKCI